MSKEMLINVSEGEECRIALLENNRIEEFYIERTSATSHVGNIYKGRVMNVEASIQAAFIDFGLGRNGFLHISDLQPSYFGRSGEEMTESVGRKLARRDRPPIQRCLRRGDEIIVQIIKEGIGTKGPTLTTYLSIPGRIIVMMPGMSKMGVSLKIEDEVERKRLRQILDQLEPPKDCGFIIRTAGIGRSKADIQRDLAYLTRLWQQVSKKMASGSGPMTLYTEGDLVTRTVRDIFTTEIDRIIIDNEPVAEQVREFIKLTSPRAKDKVELYTDSLPLFHKYNIEKDIEMMYSRHVPLPSGGSLVIDQTEAVVSIDVNSGKFRDHSDAETTAFKTDMEAADEIPRQLKLRDLGGVIICDFIDLRFDRHCRELEQKLHDAFKNDRAKTKVLRMSQFGIIELTRQRMRPSVKRSIYCDCPHCRGSGLVKTPESMSLDVMRKLAIATHDERVVRVELTVHSDVAHYLNNRKRFNIAELENTTGKSIIIKTDGGPLGLDEIRFELFDSRDGMVMIEELHSHTPQSIQEAQLMAKSGRPQGMRPERRAMPAPRGGARFAEHDERFEDLADEAEAREQVKGEPSDEQVTPDGRIIEDQDESMEAGGEGLEFEQEQAPSMQRPMPQRPMPQRPTPQMPGPRQPQQQQPPRPFEPAQQGSGEQGGFDEQQEDGRGRRRRRGRRGRGRGRSDQQQVETGAQQPTGPAGAIENEVFEHLPSNVWIQMPGEEDTELETPAEAAANEREAQTPARPAMQPARPQQQPMRQSPQPMRPSPQPVRQPQFAAPIARPPQVAAPIAQQPQPAARPQQPVVAKQQPIVRQQPALQPQRPADDVKPAPIQEAVEPQRPARKPFKRPAPQPVQPTRSAILVDEPMRPTKIADWVDVPPVRRPAKAKPAPQTVEAPVEDAKSVKPKKVARKPAAKPAAVKKPAPKRGKKGVKAEEADVSVGTDVDVPTANIGTAAEDPKVRTADEPAI